MLQVSRPIAQELLARYLKQGQALVERATLVGDLSDYESWKTERRKWTEQTAQALRHIFHETSQEAETFVSAASGGHGGGDGGGGGGASWQQQYSSDLTSVEAAIETLASYLDELGPAPEPGGESEFGAEHADAVALVHAEEPVALEPPSRERGSAPAPAPAPESEPEPEPEPALEREQESHPVDLPVLREEPAPERRMAPAVGSELTPAASNGAEVGQPVNRAVSIPDRMRQVFLAHGRDEKWMQSVAQLLERSGPHAVTVLNERPSDRVALAEQFEREAAGSHYAVVLLTADDVGAPRLQTEEEPYYTPRARQGVVFEMGFLVAALTPSCVCVLYEDGVEMPCVLDGIAYVRLDYAGTWQPKLLLQLRKAGFNYDLNKLAPA